MAQPNPNDLFVEIGEFDDSSSSGSSLKSHPQQHVQPWAWQKTEQLTSKQPRIQLVNGHANVLIDGEVLTLVEGDLMLDEDQLYIWQQAQDAAVASTQLARLSESAGLGEVSVHEFGVAPSALVGMTQDGKLVRWSPDQVLTYCVLRNTFPRDEWYEEVLENIQKATEDWERTCGVRFQYVATLDSSTSTRPPGVLFPVRLITAGGAFIAASFFPTDPETRRRMLIDPSYFTTTFDHVGVLRHELGHVLGFRHEHIRSGAPAICPHEDLTGTINLTDYDPKSVMHYFCGGVGSRSLAITDVDRLGSQQVYGPPLSTFALIDA